MDSEYTCTQCGGTFNSFEDWSTEDAATEYLKNDFKDNGLVCVVCDDCYQLIMGRTM